MKDLIRILFLLLLCGPGPLATDLFAQKKAQLSEEQRINFERNFINAEKEKMVLNYDEALKLFKACLLIDPASDAVYYNIAELYLNKKLYADAEENIRKAINLNKENIWYHKLLGEIYENNKAYEKAAEVALFLSTKEDKVPYLIQAAMLYERARNYPKAISALDKAEKETGINEEIITRKEQLYLASNKLDKAIGEMQKLCKAYPDNMRYQVLLAELYLANNKTKEGLALYAEVQKKDPGNGYAAFALGDYYHANGDQNKWFEMMKIGMASDDVEVKSKLRMMVVFISAKPFEDTQSKSQELADILILANPNESSSYLIKGDLYLEERKFSEAHQQYEKAIALEPAILVAWQQMVFCSGQMNNSAQLQKDCASAIEYFPNELSFYFYHSVASMQLKQYDKAVWSARKGLELADDDKESRVQFYATMGDAYHYLKNNSACDSAYEQALMLDSNNVYALNNYAYFLSLRKIKLDRADAMSKKSIELDPGNASYYDTYGWILYQKKEYAKAKEYIEKSLEKEPENAEVIEHLGDVYYQMNQKDKALEHWKKAKEKGSGTEFLDRKIKEGKLYE